MAAVALGGALVGEGFAPGQLGRQVAAGADCQHPAGQLEELAPALVRLLGEHRPRGRRRHPGEGALQVLQALPDAAMFRVGGMPGVERLALRGVHFAAPVQHQPFAGLFDDIRGDRCFLGTAHVS
ncbi:hypothetical protein D3C81_1436710 [compost metagenome]